MRAWRFSDIKIPCVRQVLVGEPIDHSLVSDMVRGYMHTHTYIQPRRLKNSKRGYKSPGVLFPFSYTVSRRQWKRFSISSEISFKECLFKNSLFSTNLKEKCLVRCKIGEYFIRIAYKSNWNSKTKLGKEFKILLSRDNTISGVSKNSDMMPNDCQGWHQHNEAMFSM